MVKRDGEKGIIETISLGILITCMPGEFNPYWNWFASKSLSSILWWCVEEEGARFGTFLSWIWTSFLLLKYLFQIKPEINIQILYIVWLDIIKINGHKFVFMMYQYTLT